MTAHLGCPRNIFPSITRMVSGVQYSISSWLLVLLLIRCPDCINTATIMKRWTKCQTSFESVKPVPSCPSTEQSYALRSKRMKCESYKTCGGEPCVYHCAMNPWGNATVEVCAPETLITGYYCPHFSTGVGRILEHYSYPCKDCPFNYLSTTSYKYKSCYNIIKTFEETKQIATATEQQTAKGISTAFVTKQNPCSGHQQGTNRRRLKRRVICENSATTIISPTQKLPEEKISNSSLEGAILSRSTEMTDSGATDSNTRSEYETAIICGTVFGILTLIITIFIIVILLRRKGYASCADCSHTQKLKKKQKNYEGPETQDFLPDLSKQNIERQVPHRLMIEKFRM